MMTEQIHIACVRCGAINRLSSDRLGQQPNCGKCHQALFPGKPMELEPVNFTRVIGNTEIPVIIDFWASWCGPCKMMAPIFEQVTQLMEPRARFVKLNTETAQEIVARYDIRSIPTLIIFKQGKEVVRQSGALDQASLISFVQTNL